MLGRDCGVLADQRGHHATHGFDTQRQRGHVQQQHVFDVARQHAALYRSADGNRFVRVNVFTRLFTEELSYFGLHHRHTGLTTDQDHVVDVGDRESRILQRDFQRLDRAADQIFYQRLELRAGHFDVQVFRTGCVRRDVRQVNVGLLRRRELDFRFLCRFFQALHRQRIVVQIDALIFLEFGNQIVDQTAVEVFAAQVGVTVGGQNFKGFFAVDFVDFDNRDIEGTAAQVVNRDGAVALAFIQTVSQRGCGRFVDNTFYFQTCDTAGVFGRLTLRIVKVGRNGDNGFGHRFAEVVFSGLFHFLQHFRRDLRRRHFLTFYFQPGIAVVGRGDFVRHDFNITLHFFVLEATADQTLDSEQRILRVGHRLTFSRLAHQSFAILRISNN